MARRKPNSPVHDELISLLYLREAEREAPEYKARLNCLWEEHFAGERMAVTDAEEAYLITSFCSGLAIHEERFSEALDYLDAFFAHPQAAMTDKVGQNLLLCDRVVCLFYLGRGSEASIAGASMLAQERAYDRRSAALDLRYPLYFYLFLGEQEQIASEEMTEFFWNLAQTLHFRKRRTLPGKATYAQLEEALNQTWPRQERTERREWTEFVREYKRTGIICE